MIVSLWKNSRQKFNFILHVFLQILQRFYKTCGFDFLTTCCFGYYGHAWLYIRKVIQSVCRKVLCLSPGKKSASSPMLFWRYCKICKPIMGNLDMPGYTHPKWKNQLVEDFSVYLHAKNKVLLQFFLEILNALKQLVWRLPLKLKKCFRLKDMLNFNVLWNF